MGVRESLTCGTLPTRMFGSKVDNYLMCTQALILNLCFFTKSIESKLFTYNNCIWFTPFVAVTHGSPRSTNTVLHATYNCVGVVSIHQSDVSIGAVCGVIISLDDALSLYPTGSRYTLVYYSHRIQANDNAMPCRDVFERLHVPTIII